MRSAQRLPGAGPAGAEAGHPGGQVRHTNAMCSQALRHRGRCGTGPLHRGAEAVLVLRSMDRLALPLLCASARPRAR